MKLVTNYFKNYKVKDINEPFAKKSLKKFDATCLPPCNSELYQQFLRVYFVTKMWMNSDKKELFLIDENPDVEENQYLSSTDFGWSMNVDDDGYDIKWFDGPQLPATVKDIIVETEGKNNIVITLSFSLPYKICHNFSVHCFLEETAVDEMDDQDSDEGTDDDL